VSDFNDAAVNDARDIIAEFADEQQIVFVFEDGSEREMDAIVDRGDVRKLGRGQEARSLRILVTVEEHATRGVLRTELNIARQYVKVALSKLGGDQVRKGIARIAEEESDPGLIALELM
jgi:hypothetical protein